MRKSGNFRVDSKTWFLTYPKCSLGKEEARDLLLAKGKVITGGVVAQELHEDGTPHLHVYLELGTRFSCKNPTFWDLADHHGNYQAARNPEDAYKYVCKDMDFVQWGDLDFTAKVNARHTHSVYLGKRLQTEDLATVTDDHPELIMRYKNLKESVLAYKQDKIKPAHADGVRGIWIYGPPGTGKTHYVQHGQDKDSLFMKAQNKWWCGYQGETGVLIDDLDSDCLAHYLKIWADKWKCKGEVKGGQVHLTHERLYVTSNFKIEEVFKDKPEATIKAIRRRFKVIHMLDRTLALQCGLARTRSRSTGSN